MDFNIQDLLSKVKVNNKEYVLKEKIHHICQKYVSQIEINNIRFHKGVLSFSDISSLKRVHIKRFKKEIISCALAEGIIIRDII